MANILAGNWLLLILIWMAPGKLSLLAQPAEVANEQFRSQLEAADLEMLFPTEAGFRFIPIRSDSPERYDHAMSSKSEQLEFRVRVIPEAPDNPTSLHPHLLAVRACRSAATNAPEEVITQLSLGTQELEAYRADWGVEFVFRPKTGFSEKKYAKLIVVYREGSGTGFLYLLSDQANNPALDYWAHLLRFN